LRTKYETGVKVPLPQEETFREPSGGLWLGLQPVGADEKAAPQAALCRLSPAFLPSDVCVQVSTRQFEFSVNFACLLCRPWATSASWSYLALLRAGADRQPCSGAGPGLSSTSLAGHYTSWPVTPV